MKISIVTITLNSELTLEDTIKSVIEQNVDGIELEYLIIDGGSTDRTLEIIKKYNERITMWISEPDNGISDAFNKGIALSSGDIIGIISSDDLLYENALQRVRYSFDMCTDVYYGKGLLLHKNGKLTERRVSSNLEMLKKSMSICHSSVFVNKAAYKKHGMFDISLSCVMDRDLLLLMYSGGALFKFIDHPLSIVRVGGISFVQYFKKVQPEEERISVKYGMNPVYARCRTYGNWAYMHLLLFVRKVTGKV